jgi:hypothetical protein
MEPHANSPDSELPASDAEEVDTDHLAPLARFQFAADAGFFADELKNQHSIKATVKLEENFEASAGQWSVTYVLAVPVEQADEAIPRLRQLIEDSQPNEFGGPGIADDRPAAPPIEADEDGDSTFRPDAPETGSGFHIPGWVLLLVISCGAVYLFRSRPEKDPAPAPQAASESLTDEQLFFRELLSNSPEPWVRQTEDGGRQEISFEESTGTMRIREDTDGDGSFEIDRRVQLE